MTPNTKVRGKNEKQSAANNDGENKQFNLLFIVFVCINDINCLVINFDPVFKRRGYIYHKMKLTLSYPETHKQAFTILHDIRDLPLPPRGKTPFVTHAVSVSRADVQIGDADRRRRQSSPCQFAVTLLSLSQSSHNASSSSPFSSSILVDSSARDAPCRRAARLIEVRHTQEINRMR